MYVPIIFALMVGLAVLLLAQGMIVPVSDRGVAKQIRKRLKEVTAECEATSGAMLLKRKYQQALSPLDKLLHRLPLIRDLFDIVDQSGVKTSVKTMLGLSGLLVGLPAYFIYRYTHDWRYALGAVVLGYLPILWLKMKRTQRLETIEEELPEALDVMIRSLRAGHPFSESVKMVADESEGPLAAEFGQVFDDINYGRDVRVAMLEFMARIPTPAMLNLVTAVLIQREIGGNLTEILDKISSVIRGRSKLQRKIKTLTAEVRISAWILVLMPFALFLAMYLTTPSYLDPLIKDPLGPKIVMTAFSLMILGVFWIRKLIGNVMKV